MSVWRTGTLQQYSKRLVTAVLSMLSKERGVCSSNILGVKGGREGGVAAPKWKSLRFFSSSRQIFKRLECMQLNTGSSITSADWELKYMILLPTYVSAVGLGLSLFWDYSSLDTGEEKKYLWSSGNIMLEWHGDRMSAGSIFLAWEIHAVPTPTESLCSVYGKWNIVLYIVWLSNLIYKHKYNNNYKLCMSAFFLFSDKYVSHIAQKWALLSKSTVTDINFSFLSHITLSAAILGFFLFFWKCRGFWYYIAKKIPLVGQQQDYASEAKLAIAVEKH